MDPMPTSDPAVEPDAPTLLRRHGQRTENFLRRILSERGNIPPRLAEAMEYSLLAGGKRLRPALVLESAAAVVAPARPVCSGGAEHATPSVGDEAGSLRCALAAAAAIELIHTFSLVHDDLPAMDDDDLRRGRPTNHKVFGEAMAILAGDAMVTLAFEVLAEHGGARAAALVLELSRAAGPAGMIGGQVRDIAAEHQTLDLAELERLHRMKTGALITAACRMGAIAAGADERQLAALSSYGRHLGLTFQIVDDVLDVTASAEQLGKSVGKDAGQGKNTYPRLLGIEAALGKCRRELDLALAALDPFGAAAHPLCALARFVVERQQ